MSAQTGGAGRRSGRRNWRRNADINVTPLVDVMLVLLIVFMVTAPLLTVAVPVDLPQTKAKSIGQDKEPLVVTLDSSGKIYLQETTVDKDVLVARLQAITGVNPDARIFVRGDRNLTYGGIMEVMGLISAAGYNKVALVAELPRPSAAHSQKK
ncbi:MAG: biopolymer transporter ExbD [Hyphomicrobium sp.]